MDRASKLRPKAAARADPGGQPARSRRPAGGARRGRVLLALWSLPSVALGAGGEAASVPLVDNFRWIQDFGETRELWRSAGAAAACADSCGVDGGGGSVACARSTAMSYTSRPDQASTNYHWQYADQSGWPLYHDGHTECFREADGGDYPGESPVDVEPSTAKALGDGEVEIALADSFAEARRGLLVRNDGAVLAVDVCGTNSFDCSATATFGTWPRDLRGLSSNGTVDTYFLSTVEFHWGSDDTKGSDHTACGSPRPAEMHLTFLKVGASTGHRRLGASTTTSSDRGTEVVALAVLLEGGAEEDNAAFSPVLDVVSEERGSGLATHMNHSGPVAGAVTLRDLLPETFEAKFYTYAGSLTTPPCSQVVTWFVFEDAVALSDDQLAMLREARTVYYSSTWHAHSYKALLFPFVILAMGAMTQHLVSRFAPSVPYTMLMLVEGFVLDYLASLANGSPPQNSLQQSLKMWADIDGHLLLYAFLPALLFGDAMGRKRVIQRRFNMGVLEAFSEEKGTAL